jgi:hypothetical protein
MLMAPKQVVRVKPTEASKGGEPAWKPTPQAKSFATRLRIISVVLWLAAIGIEGFSIWWLLWKQHGVNMVLLIAAIVVIAILSIVGSLLWKRANQADPASRAEPIRFFVQNQLGAILAIVAFLPLILVIVTNKNMNGQQKTIAGGIAVVAMIVATIAGVSLNPPSAEQYYDETQRVHQLTGQDLVYWTKEGSVYHLCQAASAVNLQSADNKIYSGTVGDAHAAGKDRLTLEVNEELKQCGYPVPAASGQ